MWLPYASLCVNVLVLVPVCGALLGDGPRAREAWGPASAARGILGSIYGAILVVSLGLLVNFDGATARALFAVQVLYKLTTPFTVGRLRHPVVLSNLVIAALHAASLVVLHRALG